MSQLKFTCYKQVADLRHLETLLNPSPYELVKIIVWKKTRALDGEVTVGMCTTVLHYLLGC